MAYVLGEGEQGEGTWVSVMPGQAQQSGQAQMQGGGQGAWQGLFVDGPGAHEGVELPPLQMPLPPPPAPPVPPGLAPGEVPVVVGTPMDTPEPDSET